MAKILLIEDDPFLIDIYGTKLREENFEFISAVDGASGLKTAQEILPDLVLLDIVLPKVSGLEVLAKLKENLKTRNIPIVILSNLGAAEEVKRGLAMGAVSYMVKSQFTPSEIVGRVKEILKNIKTI